MSLPHAHVQRLSDARVPVNPEAMNFGLKYCLPFGFLTCARTTHFLLFLQTFRPQPLSSRVPSSR